MRTIPTKAVNRTSGNTYKKITLLSWLVHKAVFTLAKFVLGNNVYNSDSNYSSISNYLLSLATLGDATQIEMILYVL
jgi:hypothetical protein